jgi:hypothetical protein
MALTDEPLSMDSAAILERQLLAKLRLFDHLIGANKKRIRDGETE